MLGEKLRDVDAGEIVKTSWETRGGRYLGQNLREVDAY